MQTLFLIKTPREQLSHSLAEILLREGYHRIVLMQQARHSGWQFDVPVFELLDEARAEPITEYPDINLSDLLSLIRQHPKIIVF